MVNYKEQDVNVSNILTEPCIEWKKDDLILMIEEMSSVRIINNYGEVYDPKTKTNK